MASNAAIDDYEVAFVKLSAKPQVGLDYSFTRGLATPREASPTCVTTHSDKLSLPKRVRPLLPPPPTHSPTCLTFRLRRAGVATRHLSG